MVMASWNPKQYLQFEQARLRPAIELLQRVDISNPKAVVDLGCGPGTSTRILGERFTGAKITGIDNSESMLAKAREYFPRAEYKPGDVANWKPDAPVDVVFANAVFHWLPDHAGLLGNMAAALNHGGVLAVQMPDNLDEPSHLAIEGLANSAPWKSLIGGEINGRTQLAKIGEYYKWLAREFDTIDIWRTVYAHVMESHGQIVELVKGAALTPVLSVLPENRHEEFLAQYLGEITTRYPAQPDGRVIYNFPRLFMVARKAG